MAADALRTALSERLGVAPERIVTGCGSVALAEHLARTTCLPGDQLMYSWRSFEAYPIIAATTGADSAAIANTRGHEHDLPAMAAAITDHTRMILICNPNNPTGTALRREQLDRFLDQVPANVLIVFDEAYREFVTDSEVPDALECYGDRENVVVLRTFSKAWGLAGLRVGYLVGQPAVVAAVTKLVTPFSTSTVAQLAATAALRAADEMNRRVRLVVAERHRLLTAIHTASEQLPSPWRAPESQANFVWLPVGDRATELAEACESAKVIVRSFAGEGVRVTVGTPEENDAFLAAYSKWTSCYTPTSRTGLGA
jgi:histidinol-phosphate aminotransferase